MKAIYKLAANSVNTSNMFLSNNFIEHIQLYLQKFSLPILKTHLYVKLSASSKADNFTICFIMFLKSLKLSPAYNISILGNFYFSNALCHLLFYVGMIYPYFSSHRGLLVLDCCFSSIYLSEILWCFWPHFMTCQPQTRHWFVSELITG